MPTLKKTHEMWVHSQTRQYRVAVHRANAVSVTTDLAKLTLDVEFRHRCPATGLFCGVMDDEMSIGIGFHIDYGTGEVVDIVNGQGIIAYLNRAPLPENRLTPIHLDIDKFGPNLICTIEVGNERILYPAIQLRGESQLHALLGSTPSECPTTQFGKARLRVDAR
jgi:hypothetical protein